MKVLQRTLINAIVVVILALILYEDQYKEIQINQVDIPEDLSIDLIFNVRKIAQ